MTLARNQLVDLSITANYHCVSRCVRRSFLCGQDHYSGRSYEHRRQWIESRLMKLATIYCIDIYSYAIMSNHYHLVVHINHRKALALSDRDIIERWRQEHNIPTIITEYLENPEMRNDDHQHCQRLIQCWRERLYSLSWMMKELNMSIAIQANKEDDCKGHFWEGRYKSQALLDDEALLAAMTYVDLNPVRAGLSDRPERSDYTSIKQRILSLQYPPFTQPGLAPFLEQPMSASHVNAQIPFYFTDYLQWLDWVGKHLIDADKTQINPALPDILTRLETTIKRFLSSCLTIERFRCLWVGQHHNLRKVKTSLNKQRIHGVTV